MAGRTRSAREGAVKVVQDGTPGLAVLDHVGAVNELKTLKVCSLGTLVFGVGEVAVAARAQGVRVAGIEAHKDCVTNHKIICPPRHDPGAKSTLKNLW